MEMTAAYRAQVIAWERWRLGFELENAVRASSVAALEASRANADRALARLVELGCDEAEELKRARRGL